MPEKQVALERIEFNTDDGPRILNPGDDVAAMRAEDIEALTAGGAIGTEAELARRRALANAERERDAARSALKVAEENVRQIRADEGGVGVDRRV